MELKIKNKVFYIGNKRIGVLGRDRVFRMYRTKKKHYFRIYNGWALNKQLLYDLLHKFDIRIIEIITTDTNEIYRTDIPTWLKFGKEYKNPKDINDIQLILNRLLFDVWQR